MNWKPAVTAMLCALPLFIATACGSGASADNGAAAAESSAPSTNTSNSNHQAVTPPTSKPVNDTSAAHVKSEAQNNVNQLVNAINQLH